MPRAHDPARQCLHVHDWPQADQRVWKRIVAEADPEDETRSSAADWRPATTHKNRRGYGRWLNFLIRSGCHVDNEAPADRPSAERADRYLSELRTQGVGRYTQRNRIAELLGVMLAIEPGKDWSWLKRRLNKLDALAKGDVKFPSLPVLAGNILDKAWKALADLECGSSVHSLAWALSYRNWLMLAMITLVPLRLGNFTALSIKRHLRCVGDNWRIEIPPNETKTSTPISIPIPAHLHRHVHFYLQHVRPTLLKGQTSDRLWNSYKGGEMVDHSVHLCIVGFTRRIFGRAINPHRFRHIGATSTVIGKPEDLDAARALLTHRTSTTTDEYYVDIAKSISASRQHGALIAKLRRTLPGAKRNRKSFSRRTAGTR